MDRKLDLDTAFLQDLADLRERMLCLCDGKAVAGDDNDLLRIQQQI